MVTTEQMKAALRRLWREAPRADLACLADHDNENQVEFIALNGAYVTICAQCLAELVGEVRDER